MKMMLAVMALLVSTNAFAMGFAPVVPPAVPVDTPQQRSSFLNQFYVISQAEGDAMKRSLDADPSYVNKYYQSFSAPTSNKVVFPF